MIKNFCEFGLDIIVASVLERSSKKSVKTVDQRSPSVKDPYHITMGQWILMFIFFSGPWKRDKELLLIWS